LWHIDMSFLEAPPLGSMLYAKEVPDAGGDTLWANMYMAYEVLSDGMKELLDGLMGVHTAGPVYGPRQVTGDRAAGTTMKLDQTEEALSEVLHPVVRTHPETGRKLHYLSPRFTIGIEGMDDAEAQPLLDELFAHQLRPEFLYRHRWRPGDLVMWDNRAVNHRATGGHDDDDIRLMHRTTVLGDAPY